MIQDRIKELVNALDLNTNSFASLIGVGQPVIQNIVAGRRNAPSWDTYEKILAKIPSVSAEWLGRGVQPMFLDPAQQAKTEARQDSSIGDVTMIGSRQRLKQRTGTSEPEVAYGHDLATKLASCESEKKLLQQLVESKDLLLESKDQIIRSKEEMIQTLRHK